MRVAYFAESPADQVALTILTEAILGKQTASVSYSGLRYRSGWPTVRTALRPVLKELHYRTDAEGFVLVVDSNGTPPHGPSHEPPNTNEPKCRLCQLREIVKEVRQQIRPMPNRPELKIALGLAVPAIEAWLLCGVYPHVAEAAWINGLNRGQPPYSKASLKKELYGTERPSLAVETEKMKAAASRLVLDLGNLEKLFPHGFGALCADLRGWRPPE